MALWRILFCPTEFKVMATWEHGWNFWGYWTMRESEVGCRLAWVKLISCHGVMHLNLLQGARVFLHARKTKSNYSWKLVGVQRRDSPHSQGDIFNSHWMKTQFSSHQAWALHSRNSSRPQTREPRRRSHIFVPCSDACFPNKAITKGITSSLLRGMHLVSNTTKGRFCMLY